MGTRNLTAVMMDGEYKIAQYGQWDGQPSGQGITILDFLNGEGNIDRLCKSLNNVRFIEKEGKDKALVEEYDKNAPQWSSDPDNRTEEQLRWFRTYMSRDIGGEILKNIALSGDKEIIIQNSIEFGNDALFCEYAYLIDLDKKVFNIYDDFNAKPLKSYRLDGLPTETIFIDDLEQKEEED